MTLHHQPIDPEEVTEQPEGGVEVRENADVVDLEGLDEECN